MEKLFTQLQDMGAPRDGVVIVHSSLKKIGYEANALLDGLITYFDQGILCIPTHTWDFADPMLDLLNPRSCIGTLPTIAAKDPRGTCSMHPTHSMAVFGHRERVQAFVAGETSVQTMTGPDGCYGNLYRMGGKILLAGVGLESNTYMHCVEEMLNVPNRISSKADTVHIRHLDGHLERKTIYPFYAEGIEDVSWYFPNYEPAFRKHGVIKDGSLGNAHAMLCDAVGIKEVMEKIFINSGGRELLKDATPIDPAYY